MSTNPRADAEHRAEDGTATSFPFPDAPAKDLYSACVHCGFCLEVCPTYQELSDENHSPRGRVYLIKQAAEGTLPLDESVVDPVFTCLDCRACETVCPSGVQVGQLIEQARGQVHAADLPHGVNGRIEKLFLRGLFPYPRRLHWLGRFLQVYQRWGLRALTHRLGLLKILPAHLQEMEAVLPQLDDRPALLSLPDRIPAHHRLADEPVAAESNRATAIRDDSSPVAATGAEPSPAPASKGVAALFTGCVMDLFFSSINKATVRVVARNGLDVVVPKRQVCCGALQVHAGDRHQARKLARQNIDTFLASGTNYIIINAAGCGAALKEYTELFHDEPEYHAKAEAFVAKVRDISELLVEIGFDPPAGQVNQVVTYHDACHLCHAQHIRSQPRQLLEAISGLQLVEMPDSDRCCGSAGIYNLTHPEMAGQLLDRKMDDIPTGVDAVVMGNPGCMLQIQLGVHRSQVKLNVRHTVELLDLAYSREVH